MSKSRSKAAPAATPPVRTAPVLQLHACPRCPRLVPLLVEGTGLCMRCDARYYPDLVIA